ncbi:MAG TPA: polysaccharide biosynthesis/export family protein [Chthoniobacterales bacterium]
MIAKTLAASVFFLLILPETFSQVKTTDASAPSGLDTREANVTPPVAADADYILKPSDTIELNVFREPDLTFQATISRDGFVQLPLLNEVKVGGLTIRDAREKVRRLYNADYLVEPQVTLALVTFAEKKFTIVGQITRPGNYLIKGDESIDVLQAIAMAGGFTRIANRGKVIVKRRSPSGEQTFTINTKDPRAQFKVMAGDVINIGESWF